MSITTVGADTPGELQVVANVLADAKKVVVFTGAGISTNCGIPDFRSKDGLYSLIRSEYQTKAPASAGLKTARSISGKDLFDSSLWNDERKTSVFYTFIASLRRKVREEVKETSRAHRFIRQLRDHRKLVRCYTQNIDGLEVREGLCTDWNRGKGSRSRFTKKAMELPRTSTAASAGGAMDGGCEVVQLHGDLDVLRCTICSARCNWEDGDSEAVFAAGRAPRCKECTVQDHDRRKQGKRGRATGSLRPNVVLYGEQHPRTDTLSAITTHDLRFGPDVLLILGTSLKVHGLKVMVKEFAKAVHGKTGKQGTVIFVNLTPPPVSVWKDVIDYWVAMDCDEWVDSLRLLRPCLFEIQTELALRVVKKRVAETVSQGTSKAGGDEEDKENRAGSQFPDLDPQQEVPKVVVPRSWLPDEAARRHNWWSENDVLKTPSKPTQLRTPPSSRPEPRGKGRSSRTLVLNEEQPTAQAFPHQPRTPSSQPPKQSHQIPAYHEEDAILETPCKRRKTDIRIWEDNKPLGGGYDTVRNVATSGSQQGLIDLDLAQDKSTSQAQMSGRENLAEERTSPRKKRMRVGP